MLNIVLLKLQEQHKMHLKQLEEHNILDKRNQPNCNKRLCILIDETYCTAIESIRCLEERVDVVGWDNLKNNSENILL